MKQQIDAKEIAQVTAALMVSEAKSAVKYLDAKTIVRATWHNKPKVNSKRETMIVTIGQPNYRERKFINKCALECVKLPTKPVLKDWPKKK
jgi:hypothetical protein